MARMKKLWTESEGPDGDCFSGDFLQDPELWRDRLPQPFRMIDRLLEELLARTWEEIEFRRSKRQSQPARISSPDPVQLDRYFPQTVIPGEDIIITGSLMDHLQLRLREFNTKLYRDSEVFQTERKSMWEDYLRQLQA